jgi:hypothetical protein
VQGGGPELIAIRVRVGRLDQRAGEQYAEEGDDRSGAGPPRRE